jgi:DNA adenine methylase
MSHTKPVIFEVRAGSVIVRKSGRGKRIIVTLPSEKPKAHPFLRWAGGKQWIARIAKHLVPSNFVGTYYEPFLGAANLFLAIQPSKAVLADVNKELVHTYRAIADNPDAVIKLLNTYRSSQRFFLTMREKCPQKGVTIASRFIYLNKTAWNGLYRVNPRGEFNVPYGGRRDLRICPEDRIRAVAPLFRRATLLAADFAETVSTAKRGDFVYLDPPYITGHTNNGFLSYNSKLFSWDDQMRLSDVAKRLAASGIYVLISNANHWAVHQLYRGFFRYIVERNSLIGGWEGTRGRASESLLASFSLGGVPSEVL